MLRFAKKDVRSIYTVDTGGAHETTPLRLTRSWTVGTFSLDGDDIAIDIEYRPDGAVSQVRLLRAQVLTAVGVQPPAERSGTRIELTQREHTLMLRRQKHRRFEAVGDDLAIGRIELVGWAGRRIETELPDRFPIELQLLASFYAISQWNHAANA